MTTLKTYHADEIAAAMGARLGDEGFVGLYKAAEARIAPGAKTQWWKGPAGAEFKARADAMRTEQDRDAVLDMLNDPDFKTRLGKEGVTDETELQNYALGKRLPAAADDQGAQAAKDGCPEHAEAEDGCPECAEAGVAVAIDFAIRHMVKVADALDKVGFAGVAAMVDGTLLRLAATRPIVSEAARSYKEWVSFLRKRSPEAADRFRKTYKGALEHAKKEKGLGADKAEEYAMRTALDGVPKSHLKEPTPEHGKGKSGPLAAKRPK